MADVPTGFIIDMNTKVCRVITDISTWTQSFKRKKAWVRIPLHDLNSIQAERVYKIDFPSKHISMIGVLEGIETEARMIPRKPPIKYAVFIEISPLKACEMIEEKEQLVIKP